MKTNKVIEALSAVLSNPKATDAEKREAKRLLEEQLAQLEENPTGSPPSPRATTPARPSNPYGLAGEEKAKLDRAMGMIVRPTKTHEVLPDGRLVIHAIRPSDWRRIEQEQQHRFGPHAPIGGR